MRVIDASVQHHSAPVRMGRVLAVFVAVLVVLGATAAFAAVRYSTGAVKSKQVNLTVFWWGGPERAKLTEEALRLYTKAHPDVTFSTQWQANAGYYDKLATSIAGNHAPDMFQIDDNALSEYAGRKVTLDFTKAVSDGRINLSRFPASLAAYGVVNGRTAGIAAAANTPALVYDRTLVLQYGVSEPEIGWSWEQLITWAERFTQKSGGKAFGTMDPSADYKAFWIWLRQQHKELYKGNQLGFSQDDLRRWFELWSDARKRRAAPPADILHTANTGDITKQLVATGQAATSFVWSNQLPELAKATKHQLGIASYPGDPSAQWARASMYWAGSSTTRHADVVTDVINFLVNDSDAGRALGTERGLSPNLDVRAMITTSLSGEMQDTVHFEFEMAKRFGSAPAPPPQGHTKIRALLIDIAESVQFGRATPAQAAATFMTRAAGELPH
jgi:multiple sugar transport system substrate-binding protein